MYDKTFYQKYLQSPEWAAKRRQILDRDKHKCQTCLSGREVRLEVHHKSYEHLGNEPLEELITLCNICHDAITSSNRWRRYVLGHESYEVKGEDYSRERNLKTDDQKDIELHGRDFSRTRNLK